MAEIVVFPARSDNYGYLIHEEATGRTVSIDAPETEAIVDVLEARGWTLTDILVTHHHHDHTEAIAPLKARYGAHVTGPRGEADKIEGLDALVSGGDSVTIGEMVFEVIDTPGHTLGHVSFHAPALKALFCADALFSLGCGRMFEGAPGPMWQGLKRLRALDPETMIHCGHEYTQANAKFALSVDGENAALVRRAEEVARLCEKGEPTIPSRLGEEIAANPFLRADDQGLAEKMGLPGRPPETVFAALRKAKDDF